MLLRFGALRVAVCYGIQDNCKYIQYPSYVQARLLE